MPIVTGYTLTLGYAFGIGTSVSLVERDCRIRHVIVVR